MVSDAGSTPQIDELVAAREGFVAFVRARIADPELAEDIVQDALEDAIGALDGLRDEDVLVPWFYRILRNRIVDAYRRRAVRNRHAAALPDEFDRAEDMAPDDEQALCGCFRALVLTLKPEYAAVIESELASEPPSTTAKRLAITPGNLKVRRHRARKALRTRLEETCRVCSAHGCLDCTCEESAVRRSEHRARV
ncbi:MAG: sigma-70 family RNA polymerase sigma factor [Dehalococcoidia bacterium]